MSTDHEHDGTDAAPRAADGWPAPGPERRDTTDTTMTFAAITHETELGTGSGSGLSTDDQRGIDSLPPRSALLLVESGANAGARFLLDAEKTTAGRHPSNDIFLDDVTVSRKHAEFVRGGDGFLVRDAGSLNGTYVNRERVDEKTLADGDEVQIGKYRLTYHPHRGSA